LVEHILFGKPVSPRIKSETGFFRIMLWHGPTVMALSWAQNALAVASGGAVGFSLGLIGGGRSILAVPLLLYVVGIDDAHVAIRTSALAVSLNAFVGYVYLFRRRVDDSLAEFELALRLNPNFSLAQGY
jgi:hypothetical protein